MQLVFWVHKIFVLFIYLFIFVCTNILDFYVSFFWVEHVIKRVIVYCMQIGIFFLWLCTMVDFVNDPQRFVEGGVDVVDIVALICGLR